MMKSFFTNKTFSLVAVSVIGKSFLSVLSIDCHEFILKSVKLILLNFLFNIEIKKIGQLLN